MHFLERLDVELRPIVHLLRLVGDKMRLFRAERHRRVRERIRIIVLNLRDALIEQVLEFGRGRRVEFSLQSHREGGAFFFCRQIQCH